MEPNRHKVIGGLERNSVLKPVEVQGFSRWRSSLWAGARQATIKGTRLGPPLPQCIESEGESRVLDKQKASSEVNLRLFDYSSSSSLGMQTQGLTSCSGKTHIHAAKSSLLACNIFLSQKILVMIASGSQVSCQLFLHRVSRICLLLSVFSATPMSPCDTTSHLRQCNGLHTCPVALKLILYIVTRVSLLT